MADEQDLVAYLTSKGLQVSRAAGSEITVHCWSCADGDTKGKGKLYLNTESWLHQCKRCMLSGNRKTLLEHFGDEDQVEHGTFDPLKRRRILAEAADLAHDMLVANPKALDYLLGRGLSPELIVAQKLGFVPRNVGLTDMLPSRKDLTIADLVDAKLIWVRGGQEVFNDSFTIPYFSHGTIVQIREKRRDAKYKTPAGDQVHLYNADSLWGADQVLVTEGEIDCLSVMTAVEASGDRELQSMAVVGLPGATSWPQGLVEMLNGTSKVFIGLDPDDTGMKAAAKLKLEVGTKARIVELPKGEPKTDWNDFFLPVTDRRPNGGHTWRDLKDMLTEADLAGKRMFTISDMRQKWSRRTTDQPGLKLGWPSIDAVIRPGVKPGQVVVPLAKTGTGKSAWLSNIVHNTRSHRVLYCSLELTAAECYEHLYRIHRFWNPKAGYEELLHDYRNLRITEMNRIKEGDLAHIVDEYGEEMGVGPELLIVDYLQYFSRGFRGKPYERVSDAAMELKAVGKEEDCALIVPSQVNRAVEHGKPVTTDDARDSGVVEETGDFVIGMYRPDQVQERNGNGEMHEQNGVYNLQLLKSRHGGKGRQFNMRFSNMSLAIVDHVFDPSAGHAVDMENSAYRQGIHYEDYRSLQDNQVAQGVLL